jgi:hypothetical protein
MANEIKPRPSGAFFVQAQISFAVSVAAMALGIAYLPATPWIRAFLAMGLLYVITSSLTLAKVVRDRQESEAIIGRVDEVRLERLLAEHNPFKAD